MQVLKDMGFTVAGDLSPSGVLWVRREDDVAVLLGVDTFEVQATHGDEAVKLIARRPTEPKVRRYVELAIIDSEALQDQQDGESAKGWRHRAA